MSGFVQALYSFFAHLGGLGLLLLGVLDSSFLFLPFGNDMLLVGLTSQHHKRLWYYVPLAAAGSVAGCVLLDLVARKQGEEGLKKLVDGRKLEYLKKKITERAAVSLALASIAPPPFPFTPIVAAASAFQYSRLKLFSVIAAGRAVRFALIGMLALLFGRRIIRIAQTPTFEYAVLALFAVFAAGSALSIYKWVGRMRSGRRGPASTV